MQTLRIVLIGPSGGGKTSFLNLVYTISQEKSVSEIENVLIKTKFLEGDLKNCRPDDSEEVSQTIYPMLYDIPNYRVDENTIYNLEIIDTPGFLDTRSQNQDKNNLESIRNYIAKKQLNGILVIMDHARATSNDDSSNYLVNMIKQITGLSNSKSIIHLISNCGMLSQMDEELFQAKFGDVFNYENSIFNQTWTNIDNKAILKIDKHIEKKLLPVVNKILSSFAKLEPKFLKELSDINAKLEHLNWAMDKCFEAHSQLIRSQIKRHNEEMRERGRRKNYFWCICCCLLTPIKWVCQGMKYVLSCLCGCFRNEEQQAEDYFLRKVEQMRSEIKKNLQEIMLRNKSINILDELSRFKNKKKELLKNFSESVNDDEGIFNNSMEYLTKIFEEFLLSEH